jgi:3-keto-disaccharide hydrolase
MRLLRVNALHCAVIAIFSLITSFVRADDGEEGFTSLFNGSDLTGWRYGTRGNGENKSGKGYQVEDGVIFCTKEDGGNLYTEKEYGDFIFRFEFRLEPNANNGIGIRAPLEGDSAYVGMEIQVLDDNGPQYKDKLQPWQYHGSIYNVVPAKRGALKPAGEWNSEEIYAKGQHIKVTLNGTVIIDADLGEIEQMRRELEEWSKKHVGHEDEFPEVSQALKRLQAHPGLARTNGHIGFLGHGARVEFRKMRVKEL